MNPSLKPSGIKLTGGISRRHVLIGLAALIAEAGFWSNPLFSNAQMSPAIGTAPLQHSPEVAAFLIFSTRITGHADLKPDTASRIEAAMRKTYPDFANLSSKLTLLPQAAQEPQAMMVAYAEALMYLPVADGLTVPTYCNYGPLWWTRAPPEIRVSAPVASVAPTFVPALATTDTPDAKKKLL